MSELSSVILPILGMLFYFWFSKIFHRASIGTRGFILLNFLFWVVIVFYPLSVAFAHVGIFLNHSHNCSSNLFPCGIHTSLGMLVYTTPVLFSTYLIGNFLVNSYRTFKSNHYFSLFVKNLPTTELQNREAKLLPIDKPFLGNFGAIHPVLVVSPRTIEIFNEQELKSAIEHEEAHIRKHHLLKEYIFRFFASWYPSIIRDNLYRAFVTIREIEADNEVSSRVHLASALLKSISSQKLNLVAGLIGEESLTKERIKMLLGMASAQPNNTIRALGVIASILLFIMVFLATQHIFADYHSLNKVTEAMCRSSSAVCGV